MTRRGLYAAFFAAENAHRLSAKCSHIAVYAIHKSFFNKNVRLFTVARSDNNYLHSQDAAFLVFTSGDNHFLRTGKWPNLEDALGEYFVPEEILPKKFVLPMSEVGELLRLLWLENISRAHLMPSLDNAAIALKSKLNWITSAQIST